MINYDSINAIFEAETTNMEVLINDTAYDDNDYTALGAKWLKFNGQQINNIIIHGNSYFNLESNILHLTVNNRDAKMWYLYREEGVLQDHCRFLKFRWQGYSRHNTTDQNYSLIYDVIFWEIGYISLHMVTVPLYNYDGAFTLTTSSVLTYEKPTLENPHVTFIPKDNNNTVFEVSYLQIEIQPYDIKYLLRSESQQLHTVIDDVLIDMAETELTANVFLEYGMDTLPSSNILFQLKDKNPELLYWHNSIYNLPRPSIAIEGVPSAQEIITEIQDMSDSTILGIDSISAICSEDVTFAVSFDSATTWWAYDGTTWIITDSEFTNMTNNIMANIPPTKWAEIQTSNYYQLKFILPTTESYLTSVVVNYIN